MVLRGGGGGGGGGGGCVRTPRTPLPAYGLEEFVAKSRTGFCFLQHTFATCSTLFCCETGFVLGMKNGRHCCSTRFAAMLRDVLRVFVARQYYRSLNWSRYCSFEQSSRNSLNTLGNIPQLFFVENISLYA